MVVRLLRRRGGESGEAGAVTAELAIALPAVTLLLAGLGLAGQAVLGEVRCADAARAAARVAARGEPSAAVVAEAARRAPPGAEVTVSRSGDEVRVIVRTSVSGAGWAGLTVSGSAAASVEGGP